MIDVNKIYNIDCLEGLKEIDDKSVDLIFTDIKAPRLIQFNYSSADFAAWGVSWRLRGKLWKSGCPGCFYRRKCRWGKSQTRNMRSTSSIKPMCYMGEYLRRMDSVSSVQGWTTIRRRSESTCWRCWPSSKAKESWNKRLPVIGDD